MPISLTSVSSKIMEPIFKSNIVAYIHEHHHSMEFQLCCSYLQLSNSEWIRSVKENAWILFTVSFRKHLIRCPPTTL